MTFDYKKLKGRIVEVYGKQGKFAAEMNMSERSLSLKMNCKVGWKQEEMSKACVLLGIRTCEIPNYFFEAKVQS